LQRLAGERDVLKRIAGSVEADHEAVTDQLVLANTFDVREILDARCRDAGTAWAVGARDRHLGPNKQGCREDGGINTGQRPRHHLLPK
jgi:hypothetical protein